MCACDYIKCSCHPIFNHVDGEIIGIFAGVVSKPTKPLSGQILFLKVLRKPAGIHPKCIPWHTPTTAPHHNLLPKNCEFNGAGNVDLFRRLVEASIIEQRHRHVTIDDGS